MAKVVIAIADGALIMLVLPANHRADLSKVRAALGARELWLAEEQDFAAASPIARSARCHPSATCTICRCMSM